jgi:hypothetical protein
VPITITSKQRDALYDDLLTHLSGLDGLWDAIHSHDFETADRLAHEFSDDLRLVLGGLGGGDCSDKGTVELTVEPATVRRVLTNLRDRAQRHAEEDGQMAVDEAREAQGQSLCVAWTCEQVLVGLEEGPACPSCGRSEIPADG